MSFWTFMDRNILFVLSFAFLAFAAVASIYGKGDGCRVRMGSGTPPCECVDGGAK